MDSIAPARTSALTPPFIIGSIGFAALGTLVFMAAASMMNGGRLEDRGYAELALAIHLGTVIPALFLGAWMMVARKGTRLHRLLGRIWAILMLTTSIASFGLTGLTGGIGPIHIFSVVTLVSVPWAIIAVRRGNIIAHQRAMTGPYIGLVVAGLFSFLPGRLMGNLVANLF